MFYIHIHMGNMYMCVQLLAHHECKARWVARNPHIRDAPILAAHILDLLLRYPLVESSEEEALAHEGQPDAAALRGAASAAP